MLGLLLDITIIILLFLCMVNGFKKGFILSFFNFIAYILSVILSSFLASAFSKIIYEAFIYERLIQNINDTLMETMGQDVSIRTAKVMDSMPNFVSNSLKFYDVTPNAIQNTIESSATNAAVNITKLISPTIINGLRAVLLVIFFVLLIWIFKILIKVINKIFKLPLLKQINHLVGAVFGIIKCIIILFIAMFFIRVITPAINNSSGLFTTDTINSTVIFKTMYDYNPLYSVLNKF